MISYCLDKFDIVVWGRLSDAIQSGSVAECEGLKVLMVPIFVLLVLVAPPGVRADVV